MSEKSPRPSVRFCSGCGEPAARNASFCGACGAKLRGEAGVRHGRSLRDGSAIPLPGLIVLVTFLAVGLGVWVWVLQPEATGRMPLAQRPESSPGTAVASTGALPQDHPPIAIPADVKTYITELEQTAAAAPRDVEAWKNVAQVQYRAGQVDREYLGKAKASFQYVLELDAKNLDAIRGLGNIHFDSEEYPQAIVTYSRYLELEPNDADVRTDLGTMYLYGGEEDKAIGEYDKVITKHPKFYQAHFNLGIAHAKRGETEKALESFGKAKALAPDDQTKAQIQTMMDRTGGPSESGAAGQASAPPAGATSLQSILEKNLRTHPIVGPKVVKIEWPTASSGRVLLDNFPMQNMPEAVRTKFLDRLKTELADAKRRTGAAGTVALELVDNASGQVMATVRSDGTSASGPAEPPTAGAASPPATSLASIVERNLRSHPIVGPKVTKVEWPTATSGRVLLDYFPMQDMPEAVRTKFLDRLKTQLTDAKRQTAAGESVKLELVDEASGQVMATVVSE
ncbi:MAG: tetratricopeptide repeat protein [Candidatus Binatia bacterium]